MVESVTKKDPSELREELKSVIKKEINRGISDDELEAQIEAMTKIEVMDKYFDSFTGRVNSFEICRLVNQLFGFDLETKSVLQSTTLETASSVIELYLDQQKNEVTGANVRIMINEIFGINLDAIAALEKARISLYSKNQWVVHHEKDLFVVQTGAGDVDVWVYPTDFFMEQTGIHELPMDLQHALTSLGYTFNKKIGSYYYSNPTGEAVPDSFKGQTIGAIVKIIQQSFLHL